MSVKCAYPDAFPSSSQANRPAHLPPVIAPFRHALHDAMWTDAHISGVGLLFLGISFSICGQVGLRRRGKAYLATKVDLAEFDRQLL